LVDDPPGTDVEVTNLAVAHLALREADATPGNRQSSVGAAVGQAIKRRRLGASDRVSSVVIAESPAVENHERSLHTCPVQVVG
jgi:hypothetical protein